MKTYLFSTIAAAILTTSAMAADLRMPTKAPAPLPVPATYNWTGCYVAGGGGYGSWNEETATVTNPALGASTLVGAELRSGGRGWFGTVGAGCDYQSGAFVFGIFGDYDFANLKGDMSPPSLPFSGPEKMKSAWYVGGRIGYVIAPNVLTYVGGGWTQARFSQVDLFTETLPPFAMGLHVPATTYSGWFVGGGFEYNLGFLLGVALRTDYRFASYDRKVIGIVFTQTGAPYTYAVDSDKFVQTIRTELVWRFNWLVASR